MSELFLDYEFNRITHPNVHLVCCATFDPIKKEKKKFWLHESVVQKKMLKQYLSNFETIIGYSCVAEARSFLSLGLDPLSFKWIDLFFEYRCITNHNDKMQWGKQLVEGKIKHVRKPKPKWERSEEDKATGFRATHSLSEATFNLTGKIRDTKHKTAMRDLIISDPKNFSDQEKKLIMDYCLEDVIHLPEIWGKIQAEFLRLDSRLSKPQLIKEAKVRGRYAAHTALMENHGYPIDVEKTKNFSSQVGHILYDCQKEINNLFPEIKPFRWNKKDQRFTWDQIRTRQWVTDNCNIKLWDKTDGGQLSLSLEAFQRQFDFKHDYPTDNFGAQIVRFLKLKQNLYGFVPSPNKTKKNFWSSVGPDGRVRAYLNPFGAQSSRSQPGATGFLFLKPAWMRALCVPAKGKFLAGIDYGSQEFFIQAIRAKDKNMLEAYLSGDPYLHFGKLSGSIPKEGTKETHKKEREAAKATTLGISYLMSKYGLAIKLTNDVGRVFTEEEAEKLIKQFYEVFSGLKEYQDLIISDYKDKASIKLPCGWYMFGDNDNHRSVTNIPTQGEGASIMRAAVDIAVSRGVKVIKTLHDAIYIEGEVGQETDILILRNAMREAFIKYLPQKYKEVGSKIRLDPFAWSPNYKRDSTMKIGKEGWEIETSDLYLDARALVELNNFSKYFNKSDIDLL